MGETTKRVRAHQPDLCAGCQIRLGVANPVECDVRTRAVLCSDCAELVDASSQPTGPADPVTGSGARHRERRGWPASGDPAGGPVVVVPAQRRRRPLPSADGDTSVTASGLLEQLCGERAFVLHHRNRARTGRGEVDHVAVTGSGVHVVAVRHTHGATVTVHRDRTRSARHHRLLVGGRDETGVVEGLLSQVLAVSVALGSQAVPLQGLVWFVDGELPGAARRLGLGGPRMLRVRGVPVVGGRGAGARTWPSCSTAGCRRPERAGSQPGGRGGPVAQRDRSRSRPA